MGGLSKNQRRELIELAALFVAAGLTDIFTDVLGHRIEGPSILIVLGVVVGAVAFGRHRPRRRGRAVAGSGSGSALLRGRAASAALSDRAGALAGSSGRLWRVRTLVGDTPGRLAVVAGAFAAVGANILTLEIHPVDDGVVDEFLVQAEADVTPQRLGGAVAAAGGGQVHVEAADVTALADVPTRALTLARQLADGPEQLGRVLAEFLGAAEVVWRPAADVAAGVAAGVGDGEGASWGGSGSITVAVSQPRAGVLVVSRAQVPFTLVEVARAQAMADLASALCAAEAPARS